MFVTFTGGKTANHNYEHLNQICGMFTCPNSLLIVELLIHVDEIVGKLV